MMSNSNQNINQLEVNVKKLIERHTASLAEIDALKQQLKQVETDKATLSRYLENINAENRSLKAANAMLGSTQYKRETKLKINSLIREIDQCIVQLTE